MPKPRIAFTALVHEGRYVIGAAEENIAGWSPTTYQTFDTYNEAKEFAHYINTEKLHLTDIEATEIVLSSMFPRKITSAQHNEVPNA